MKGEKRAPMPFAIEIPSEAAKREPARSALIPFRKIPYE